VGLGTQARIKLVALADRRDLFGENLGATRCTKQTMLRLKASVLFHG